MIAVATEGVVTVVPGTDIRAKRYTSKAAVPLLMRANARQVGAAGYWYVQLPDTPAELWDKITGKLASNIQAAHEAIGADKGLIGIAESLLGVPRWLVLAVLAGAVLLAAHGAADTLKTVRGN